MKKKSPPYAVIGAALLGIAALFLGYEYKSKQDAAHQADLDQLKALQTQIDQLKIQPPPPVTPTPTNMRNVFFATQPVEAGAKISSAFFEKKLTPDEILPDAFPADSTDVVGFYAIRNIEKGDPLTPHNIGRSPPYLSPRIAPGMRAISLPVFNAEDNNTGGFAVDGDKVDLLYTTFSLDGSQILKTEVIMQNLEVLFVPGSKVESDQMGGIVPIPPPGAAISITFQVTPEQAEALTFMTHVKNGQFSMILRSRSDKSQIKFKPVLAEDVAGNLQKIQKIVDKSIPRVRALATQIEAEAKRQAAQGNTNETTNPTPPPSP